VLDAWSADADDVRHVLRAVARDLVDENACCTAGAGVAATRRHLG
jgi:hypothetical protein